MAKEYVAYSGVEFEIEWYYSEKGQSQAFKPHPHRFLCFFTEGGKIIVTNAFWKKQDRLPQDEKQRALNCKESHKRRIEIDSYYEKEG